MCQSIRQARHLKYTKSELRKNNRFLRESSLLMPNGQKLHEICSADVDIDQYCIDHFGKNKTSLIDELMSSIKIQHEKAIDIRAKAQSMINSPLFNNRPIHITIALSEVENLLIPCVQQEYLDSIYELGLLYMEHGHLLGKSEIDFYPLVEKAAKKGHSDAPYNLGVFYLKKEEWSKAEEFFLLGAKKENCLCLNKLAEMAEQGLTKKLLKSDAARYYIRAMRGGLPIAAVNLARLIFIGEDKEHSVQDAVDFLEEAAKDGEAKAMCQLGFIYEEGEYVDVDFKKSLSFYKQAADLGNPDGQYLLGFIYKNLWQKFSVKRDVYFCLELYKKAAEQGQIDAINALKNGRFF